MKYNMISTQLFDPPLVASSMLHTQRDSQPHRILLIEDNPYVCHSSAEVLISHGFEVNAAEDGATGWQELKSNKYSLLITAQDLPRLTGFGLVKKIRTARMDLPVIITGSTYPSAEFRHYPWLQPATTLIKPYSLAELLGKVKEFLTATSDALSHLAPRTNRLHRL